jgi:threonine/homoserine/homoserine lactone efflux protein
MPSGTSLLGFVAAALVVLLIPGPGVLYIVARSAGQGHRAGLASVLGLSAGALVHVVAATAGLSTILLTSATAFGIVKALGAAYLIYLGLTTLFAGRPMVSIEAATPLSLYRVLTDGVVVSVFNPKIAVFFLAFLPQFVDPGLGPVARQVFLLGLIYVGLALITDGAYALLAGSLRPWLNGRAMQGPLPRYVSGSVYLGLGVNAALTGRQHYPGNITSSPRFRLVFDRLKFFPHSEIDTVIPLTWKIPRPIKSLTDLTRQLVKIPG